MFIHHRFLARPRSWTTALTIAGIALALFWQNGTAHATSGQDYARQTGAQLVGRTVPPLTLTTIDGKALDLAALRGRKAVYLKFWATWCAPCREQMPHFEKIQRGAGDDLQVVAINIGFDDTPAQVASYRREHGLTMPIVRDADGRLGELFGLRVTPQHVVIGKDGRIAYVGHLADAALETALAQARQQATAASATAAAIQSQPVTTALRAGATVPTRKVTTLEGYEIPLADPAGQRISVLAFMTPWCESYFAKSRPQSSRECRLVREQLVALGRDRRVRWLGIASGLWASEADLREYRDEHRIPVPLTLDRDGALFRRFAVRRVPSVIVVDAQGRIVRQIGMDELENGQLQKILPLPTHTVSSSRAQP